jgi:cobalt-zinc-cadmium efflux system protein
MSADHLHPSKASPRCPHVNRHAPLKEDPEHLHDDHGGRHAADGDAQHRAHGHGSHKNHHDHHAHHDSDDHHDSHDHGYRSHDKSLLLIAFVITATTMVVEIVGGLVTHSLALVSDGIHMFTHAFALALSWGAIVLAARPANMEKTFGYYRVEVVAAFVNGLTILGSAVWIVVEGVTRLVTPEPVAIGATLVIAIAGLVINIITGAILMRGDQGNLNVRSAFLHMLTDTLSSVAIIIGLIVIHYTSWQFIDPLLALIVAVVIVKWSWSLLSGSLHVLLEGSPVDVGALRTHVLERFPDVIDMHDVHVWQISQRFNCLTAHVRIAPEALHDYASLVARINQSLQDRFDIGHTNLQPEWG